MANRNPTALFAAQRASAVILAPLALWFLWSLATHAGDDLAGARTWLGHLHNKILFGLFVTAGAFHGRIGLHEIVEDYIHGGLNGPLNALASLAATGVAIATWVALFLI